MGKLFDKHLKTVLNKKHDKVFTLTDGRGLGARVSEKGKVRWQYRYKIDGKSCRMDLGDYPELSLLNAREEAQQCREWLAQGYDPKHQRSLVRNETLKPVSVKDALEYWLVNYAENNRSNVDKHQAQFEKHIYPYIGQLPLTQTDTRHWIECFDRITHGIKGKQQPAPVASGYVLINAKQALQFCRTRNYAFSRALDDLTVPDVGKKQAERDRFLSDSELVDVWNMATEENSFCMQYYKDLFRLLILLGGRTREIRLSTWVEWDFKEMLWTVPKAHSKNGEKVFRPIPLELKSWLLKLKGDAKKSDPILGVIKTPEAVSQYTRLIWKKLKHDEKWTIHDLRRTLATGMSDLGVAPHIVEQLLGHKLGGVMQIYNRSRYLPEKAEALSIWIERVNVLAGLHENVVIMRSVNG
ncbi:MULTISPECIES: tyrosine-type recombinase/integrase [Vibrio]|uniref:tyrosine-type recombinase/integrase n=1 Tax=Vibrio TaxID=662 RepID=UPI0021CFAFA8|nr:MULTISPECIES: site-specific integrase [unclassified Vibrio]MDW1606823.1 site-specific integrase [Vibrio sp. Vb2977]MDW1669728.1 site-specific integrase [Vibrio sp. Vb2978]MDW1683867.1 site-specific integrase [Vibrio sp. Vb2942]